MIRLAKLEEPQLLKDNKDDWTRRYVQLVNKGEPVPNSLKYKYREKEIKEQIILETHNKCAYCESKIGHVCTGDVEHIIPKSKRPDLYVEWTNLTLACEECNRTGKKDYYDPNDPLINPYIDNPDNHLIAAGPLILNIPGDRKGYITKNVLDLNRSGLIERRVERIRALTNLAEMWAKETNGCVKSLLETQLKKEAEPDKEYSFIVKKYLQNIGINI